VTEEDRVYYQEVDFVATHDKLVTVVKTPPGEKPFDTGQAKLACKNHEEIGMYVYHLVDQVAERYLDLVDDLDEEIDELEDRVAEQRPPEVGRRLRDLRHDLLGIRRTLSPTRDEVHRIVDGRVELEGEELFPRDVEIAFGDAYDKLLRSWESLDSARDAIGGVRDYLQGKIANDQNEVMKKLTAIASMLLVPTFIVGLYGQNLRGIPEFHWKYGYAFSWMLIIVTTLGQFAYFRHKKWI
jgi:magnesium transporter